MLPLLSLSSAILRLYVFKNETLEETPEEMFSEFISVISNQQLTRTYGASEVI